MSENKGILRLQAVHAVWHSNWSCNVDSKLATRRATSLGTLAQRPSFSCRRLGAHPGTMQKDADRSGQPPAAMAIPGAREEADVEERWRAALVSAGSEAASLAASIQDAGFFGSSMRRRNSSDYGYGSLSHGHGAWLSSSPHPRALATSRPSVHRSPSFPVRCCFRCCSHHMRQCSLLWGLEALSLLASFAAVPSAACCSLPARRSASTRRR